jgi:hypothetical protein
LDELRPLVREYERLQAADAALADGSPPSGTATGPARPGAARRRHGGGGPGGRARRTRSAGRLSASAEREIKREKFLVLVRERPGITKAELKDAAGMSSAAVAQTLRRMLDRGQVREQASPGGAIGYRIADDPTAAGA